MGGREGRGRWQGEEGEGGRGWQREKKDEEKLGESVTTGNKN